MRQISEGSDRYREPTRAVAYEGILYNAVNNCIVMRSKEPIVQYPMTVEALIIALPRFNRIEENVEKFRRNEWQTIKRDIQHKEKDERRARTLAYDSLFLYIKHQLERSNLLLKFKEIPVGGTYQG